jgi:hypothetical protein
MVLDEGPPYGKFARWVVGNQSKITLAHNAQLKEKNAPRHKFPCVPNSVKFGGNTSYGSRMINFFTDDQFFHQVLPICQNRPF